MRSRNPVKHGYKFKGEVLKHVFSAKYLQVEISSEMKWDKHINNAVNKETELLVSYREILGHTLKT